MNYKNKQNTEAYKKFMAYKLGGGKNYYAGGGVKKYNTAGMYAPNTVSAAGQQGNTASIVFQESDPQVLQAKLDAMEAEKQRILNQQEGNKQEIQEIAQEGDVAAQEAAANVGSKVEGIAKTGAGIIDNANKLTDGKLAEYAKETGQKLFGKTAEKSTSLLPEGYKIGDLSKGLNQGKSLFGSGSSGLGLGSQSTGLSLLDKSSSSLFKPLNFGTSGIGSSSGTLGSSLGSTSLGSGSSSFSSTLSSSLSTPGGFTPGTFSSSLTPPPTGNLSLLNNTKGSLISTGASQLGTEAAKTGLMRTTGFGAAGVGSGMGKFLTSGAGIGTVASLAGMGVSALADDNDPTKLNFGEGTGAVLSGVGTGLGAAAMAGAVMGTAVPVIGNIVGGVLGAAYGLGKALIGRKKARKAKREFERKKKAKVDKMNKELVGKMTAQGSAVRAGEIAQKTYSGYDLGTNVVARDGGPANYSLRKNVSYGMGGRLKPLMKYA